jgi:outer membrane protein OmpA-like peptidoglycan-associated protein
MPRLLALALAALPGLALSQNAQPLPAFSLSRFTLSDGGRGGMAAATGDVLPQHRFRATLAIHYENNPLVYYRNTTRIGSVVAHRAQLHLGLGFGITSWLQAAAELPVVVAQGGDDLVQQAGTLAPDSFGVGSPRLALRVQLLSQYGSGLAVKNGPLDLALQVGLAFPFGTGNALNVESGWNVVPQLSLGREFGPVRVGGEVTALIRPATALTAGTLKDTVGSQLGIRALLSSVGDGARFEASFHSLVALEGEAPPGFELLGGARVPVGPLELFALGGPGFGNLPGTPSFRLFAGVGIKPQADRCEAGRPHEPADCPELDLDGDGVINRKDRCPTEAEDRDGFDDDDGCPDPDNDGDRVPDAEDECPIDYGPRSNKGCPVKVADRDYDGTPDTLDKCPDQPGPKSREGCPLIDQDGDGVEDALDACPTEYGPKERKGCPLVDRDGDGVEDARDNCPDVKGTPENQGCPPEEKQLVIITSEKLVITEKVYFATGKATILPVSFPLLNQVAKVLRSHPEIELVTVEGHTDDQGSAKLNRKLSLNRAKAVKAYLEHQGIEPSRLNAQGFGPDRPADTNATEAGRANNRRVEFIIESKQ